MGSEERVLLEKEEASIGEEAAGGGWQVEADEGVERGEVEESSGWSLGGFEGPLGGFVMGGEGGSRGARGL